jgi:hypothetical protein
VTAPPGASPSWWALDVVVPQPQHLPLAAFLVSLTGMAVEEKADGTLVTFADGPASRLPGPAPARGGGALSRGGDYHPLHRAD